MKLKSQILFDEKTIRTQVKRVAEEIARDFGGDDTDLVCVCVLRGAVMFYADLMKELTLENVVYDFVTLQSYESARIDGGTMGTTGVIKLIQELRNNGISAEGDHNGRSFKSQFKYANKLNVKYTVVVGANELETGLYNFKDMATGEQKQLSPKDIVNEVINNG